MPPESGLTKSCWMEVSRAEFPKLQESIDCDVCVIGAGIAGLTAAYLLAKAGKSVVVADAGRIVCGETQRTTAHISDVLDESFESMISMHGKENVRLIKESLTASINQIAAIIEDEKIDCDYKRVDGFLWYPPNSDGDALSKEKQASLDAGHESVEQLDRLEAIKGAPRALRYSGQAQFHSIKYLNGLTKALHKLKVPIYADSRAEKVETKHELKVIFENKSEIKSESVIVATCSPITDLIMQLKQTAYRTFAIAIKIAKNTVPAGLFWDTEDPYHYVRTQPLDGDESHELLIVGGEDHRTGDKNDAEERFARLQEWATDTFSITGEIVYKWSGQVYEPVDGLGFIGLDPELKHNVYLITGDSGMGITNGTVGAMLIRDLIMQKDNPWEKIYSPARISLKSAKEFVAETGKSLSKYVDNVFPNVVDEAAIASGEGAIIEQDGKKLAAYRHEDGELTGVSPYCTHLGGILCWNSCEKSWDCPVHGSRFAADGDLISGPADGNLK